MEWRAGAPTGGCRLICETPGDWDRGQPKLSVARLSGLQGGCPPEIETQGAGERGEGQDPVCPAPAQHTCQQPTLSVGVSLAPAPLRVSGNSRATFPPEERRSRQAVRQQSI